MRITYRSQHNRDYWEERWNNVCVDHKMENKDVYPLKYAEMILDGGKGKVLEAGCGAGRLLRYYKDLGWDIKGIDFIASVIDKLKAEDADLDVEPGDITKLQFDDETFMYVLAFGLYHNLETGIDKALSETARVLKKNGKLCASFRADNMQTKLVDFLANEKSKRNRVRS
jgi:SAM-dependent methyltransferase